MSRIELAPETADDFDRILKHLEQYEATATAARIEEILHAISVLRYNPLVGHPTRDDLRELVIGRRSQGYVALYRYIAEIDTAFVLAIRSQKDAGYKRP